MLNKRQFMAFVIFKEGERKGRPGAGSGPNTRTRRASAGCWELGKYLLNWPMAREEKRSIIRLSKKQT